MRVAFLVDPLTARIHGGLHARALARELEVRGHEIRSCGAPLDLADEVDDSLKERVSTGERLQAFGPEAIVAYDGLSPAAWLGARASRRHGVPLVLVEPALIEGGALPWRFLHRVGERLWGNYVRQAASAVVAVDPVARELALSEGFPERRISILPEGVDIDQFRPGVSTNLVAQRHIRGRILLYTGPLEVVRNLSPLIRAFGRTVGQRQDWKLVLAGEGPARRRLQIEVDRLGLGTCVLFLPRPAVEDLPGLMGASTLLAAPAHDASVRGRQVARAMACGLPVIASDVPRLRFLVEHEGSGLLAEPGNEESWTRALQSASHSPERRRRWGLRGRELACQRLDWRRIAEAFETILHEARERAAA